MYGWSLFLSMVSLLPNVTENIIFKLFTSRLWRDRCKFGPIVISRSRSLGRRHRSERVIRGRGKWSINGIGGALRSLLLLLLVLLRCRFRRRPVRRAARKEIIKCRTLGFSGRLRHARKLRRWLRRRVTHWQVESRGIGLLLGWRSRRVPRNSHVSKSRLLLLLSRRRRTV